MGGTTTSIGLVVTTIQLLKLGSQAICAEIWRDAQQGDLDLSLNRYRPLVEGRDQDLFDALRALALEKRQERL